MIPKSKTEIALLTLKQQETKKKTYLKKFFTLVNRQDIQKEVEGDIIDFFNKNQEIEPYLLLSEKEVQTKTTMQMD